MWSSKSASLPPVRAYRLGLVVTPARQPQESASLISSRSAVSMKNFMFLPSVLRTCACIGRMESVPQARWKEHTPCGMARERGRRCFSPGEEPQIAGSGRTEGPLSREMRTMAGILCQRPHFSAQGKRHRPLRYEKRRPGSKRVPGRRIRGARSSNGEKRYYMLARVSSMILRTWAALAAISSAVPLVSRLPMP